MAKRVSFESRSPSLNVTSATSSQVSGHKQATLSALAPTICSMGLIIPPLQGCCMKDNQISICDVLWTLSAKYYVNSLGTSVLGFKKNGFKQHRATLLSAETALSFLFCLFQIGSRRSTCICIILEAEQGLRWSYLYILNMAVSFATAKLMDFQIYGLCCPRSLGWVVSCYKGVNISNFHQLKKKNPHLSASLSPRQQLPR